MLTFTPCALITRESTVSLYCLCIEWVFVYYLNVSEMGWGGGSVRKCYLSLSLTHTHTHIENDEKVDRDVHGKKKEKKVIDLWPEMRERGKHVAVML